MGEVGTEIKRMASLLVAFTCLVITFFFGSRETLHLAVTVVVLPLGCIWYGGEIGSFVGMSADEKDGTSNITGALIAGAGWVVLFSMLGMAAYVALGGWQ